MVLMITPCFACDLRLLLVPNPCLLEYRLRRGDQYNGCTAFPNKPAALQGTAVGSYFLKRYHDISKRLRNSLLAIFATVQINRPPLLVSCCRDCKRRTKGGCRNVGCPCRVVACSLQTRTFPRPKEEEDACAYRLAGAALWQRPGRPTRRFFEILVFSGKRARLSR